MTTFNKDEIDALRYVCGPDARTSEEISNWIRSDTDMRITRVIFSENRYIKPKKVIINDPATIIFWNDGTKTVVKCDSEDEFDKEKGILYAALKKLSTKEAYNDILRAIDSTQDPFVEGVIFCEGK